MSQQPPEERTKRPHEDEEVELPRTQARQGATMGHMRWVLRISLVLVVIGLFAAWLLL